jgi:hypothetical protein
MDSLQQLSEYTTGIVVGHGPDVPTALKTLAQEIDKSAVAREWEMKHFTMYQEMKLVPLQQTAQIVHYAIAVLSYKSVGLPIVPRQEQ